MSEILEEISQQTQSIVIESSVVNISIPQTAFQVQIPTKYLQEVIRNYLDSMEPKAIGKL